MSERYRVFFCEPTGRSHRFLRRFTYNSEKACPGCSWGHDVSVPLDTVEHGIPAKGERIPAWISELTPEIRSRSDWPTKCERCDYVFEDADQWQVNTETEYRRTDTGETLILKDAPAGAIWDAWWMADVPAWCGPDGRSLVCRCPDGHDWMIDAHASNCTMPDDDVHKCWVRHGRPEDGDFHVDKNGHTCAAGAGSIQTPKWHGFLHHGELYRC